MKALTLLMVALVASAGVTACGLQGKQPDIGLDCDTAGDCEGKDLGCVPTDDENPNGERVCMPPAAEWTCAANFFGDGACDCGCAILDVDCPNANVASCSVDGNNCPAGENPVPTDNTQCQ